MNLRNLWKIYGRAFLWALGALYLPHLWVFYVAVRWPSDYHWMWTAFFPAMPGLFLSAVVRTAWQNFFQYQLPDGILLLIAVVFSLVLIAILTTISARGKPWQIAAFILGTAYSIVATLGLYAASRA